MVPPGSAHFIVQVGDTTYVVARNRVPEPDVIEWRDEECDAFVAVLDAQGLTDDVADSIAAGVVALRTEWVETMGPRSEDLHDRIDVASVAVGRQRMVGDGDPMTAWHADMLDLPTMVGWVRTGGHGSADNKLVVVVGGEDVARAFAAELRRSGTR